MIVSSVCTAFITAFIFLLYNFCCTVLCVFYNYCCLVRINKWTDGWIAYLRSMKREAGDTVRRLFRTYVSSGSRHQLHASPSAPSALWPYSRTAAARVDRLSRCSPSCDVTQRRRSHFRLAQNSAVTSSVTSLTKSRADSTNGFHSLKNWLTS